MVVLIIFALSLASWSSATTLWEYCFHKKIDARLFTSLKFKYIILYLISCVVIMLLSTYFFCVMNKQCKIFLPSISEMFDYFPGNVFSRLLLSQISLLLGLSQVIFWNGFTFDYDGTKVGFARKNVDRIFLVFGVLACLGLSIVGAVCDNERNVQCKGNKTLHSWAGGFFFFCYNVNILVLSARSSETVSKYGKKIMCRGFLLFLAIFITITKLRLIPQVAAAVSSGFGEGTSLISLFEWIDIVLQMLWTAIFYVTQRTNFELQLMQHTKLHEKSINKMTLACFSVTFLYNFIAVIIASTIIISEIFAFKIKNSVTYLSDTFINPPGNMISRWGIPLASTLSIAVHICIYYMDGTAAGQMGKRGRNNFVDKGATMLAILALIGLAIMGCSSQAESLILHKTSAGIFYIMYNLFMYVHSIRTLTVEGFNCTVIVQLLLAFVLCLCTVMVAISIPKYNVVLETIAIFSCFMYMGFSVFKHKSELRNNIVLSIVHLGKVSEEDTERLL